MSKARAVRYRRLALAEEDKAKADLLLLADECDRGPVRVAASSEAAHPHVPLLVGRQDYRHRLKMDRLDPGVRRGQTRLEFPNVSYLPHFRPIPRTCPVCRTLDVFRRSCSRPALRD